MNKRLLISAYVVSDWLTGAASWTVLFAYRKVRLESAVETTPWDVLVDFRYLLGPFRHSLVLDLVFMHWQGCTSVP